MLFIYKWTHPWCIYWCFEYINEVLPLLGSSIFGECGIVASDSINSIKISALCRNPLKYRMNQSLALTNLVLHEVRHTWQFNIARINEDADKDYVPKSVPPISVVGLAYEDGNDKTRGDTINDSLIPSGLNCDSPGDLLPPATCENPYFHNVEFNKPISFSRFQAERDAARFSCNFAYTPEKCQ